MDTCDCILCGCRFANWDALCLHVLQSSDLPHSILRDWAEHTVVDLFILNHRLIAEYSAIICDAAKDKFMKETEYLASAQLTISRGGGG